MRRFVELLHVDDDTRVLDAGGTPGNWSLTEARPQLTIMNIDEDKPRVEGGMRFEFGDGRSMCYGRPFISMLCSRTPSLKTSLRWKIKRPSPRRLLASGRLLCPDSEPLVFRGTAPGGSLGALPSQARPTALDPLGSCRQTRSGVHRYFPRHYSTRELPRDAPPVPRRVNP